VYFRDITQRKLTELRLIESEQRYSELFQLSPLPKFVFDVKTLQFLDVNAAAVSHYGYSREEFLAMTVRDLRRTEDIPQLNEILAAYESDEPYIAYNAVIHRKKNGEVIQTDLRSNAVSYQGRRARLVVARDITESLKHLRAIEAQNEKLREIAWMQSHVVRAPLARMMGLISLLERERELPADLREMLDFLYLSAKELDDVIGTITDKTGESDLDLKYPGGAAE
jgi:PAS domain S-box-containing protein